MEIMRSYRLELKLNATQRVLCHKSAGTARYAYNWKLHDLNEQYRIAKAEAEAKGLKKVECKPGNAMSWHKEWNALKNERPWIRETSKCCGQESLRDLQIAFQRFFARKSGYPKFKKKGQRDSFRVCGRVYVGPDFIHIPILGRIRLKEKNYPRHDENIKLSQATVSRQADRWFVSFFIKEGECPETSPLEGTSANDVLGVDLGIKDLAITSGGRKFDNPKAYSKHLNKLKRYQRMVSRKQKGSNNRRKAVMKLARVHKRIADIRNDAVHKLTTSLVKAKPKIIVIETLKPKNMSKNHSLAGSILDASFGKIKETLKYKCAWNGIHLVMAHPFYASSKYCSCCGHKHKDLKLSDREWTCSNCHSHLDRDVNAAKNLQYYTLWLMDKHIGDSQSSGSSPRSNACGDERLQFLTEQCSSVKQEFRGMHNNA